MQTLLTVTPIFILIVLGYIAARINFLPEDVQGPLNRLVFYFAIPAFIFHSISNFPLSQGFNAQVLAVTMGAAFTFYVSGWLLSKLTGVPNDIAGVLVQGSCHGNLGYIGLPVAFYFLGDTGLAQAGIIAGFMMILQNVMSISVLQSFTEHSDSEGRFTTLIKLMQNPIIIACMLGIFVSGLEIPIPEVANRTLKMLGQLAPPAALLLIGASISFEKIRSCKLPVVGAVSVKLILLPAFGLLLFTLLGTASSDYMPALIHLGTPTATVAYVLARQMKANVDAAVAIISATTLISALTMPLWLALLSHL